MQVCSPSYAHRVDVCQILPPPFVRPLSFNPSRHTITSSAGFTSCTHKADVRQVRTSTSLRNPAPSNPHTITSFARFTSCTHKVDVCQVLPPPSVRLDPFKPLATSPLQHRSIVDVDVNVETHNKQMEDKGHRNLSLRSTQNSFPPAG